MREIKILVCDDEKNIQESIKLILEKSGYDLHFASNGTEAVEKAKKLQPQVILLDIKMPKLSGMDALSEITTASPQSKIIIISGYEQPQVIKEALSRGAVDYLAKSFSREQLKESIQAALKNS
jgi:CheY-like chemotaxis protein